MKMETSMHAELLNDDDLQQLVLNYLKGVLSAICVLCDCTPKISVSLSSEVLVKKIASQLMQAFDPDILTAPLPPSLAIRKDRKTEISRRNIGSGHHDDEPLPDAIFSQQQRRLDYLRPILRAMAPISFDVAVLICVTPVTDVFAAAMLFGTWLPLAPQLTPLVTQYFCNCKNSPLEFSALEPAPSIVAKCHILEALHSLCCHYARRQEQATLKKWWSWAPLYQYLQISKDQLNKSMANKKTYQTTRIDMVDFGLECVRWHAARAIGYVSNMNPVAMGEFLKQLKVDKVLVPWVQHPWILHEEEYQWEMQHRCGSVGLSHIEEGLIRLPTLHQVRRILPLHPCLVQIGESITFFKQFHNEDCKIGSANFSDFVLTSTTTRNVTLLGVALATDPFPPPILVSGPAGCGKSSLIRFLVHALNSSSAVNNLLELHVDDETDSKTLIGSYTTTDIPGEFTWQPGALTRAVREGQWVLMEDLDSIPIEVQSTLIPLLRDRQLPLGNGKTEPCHENFRIFSTVTTGNSQRNSIGKVLSQRLWHCIEIEPLTLSEWKEIARTKHPHIPDSILTATIKIFEELVASREHSMIGRTAATRDFLKLISRISNSVNFRDQKSSYATESQRALCLSETLDVFAAHCPDAQQSLAFAMEIAAPSWGLTADLAKHYLESRRPELVVNSHMTQIGRVQLQRPSGSEIDVDSLSMNFAPTHSALRLMESLAVCVRESEPTLVVGETGIGKTTVIQQLAQVSGNTLVVQNLSLSTDSTDLLGGYRPLELSQIARKNYLIFVELFVSTFSRSQNADFLVFASNALEKSQYKKLSQCFRRAAKLGINKCFKANSNDIPSLKTWQNFAESAEIFDRQRQACDTKLAFSFTEGALVEAIREGKWVLLDEINLASSETLQRLSGLLDDSSGSITLTEKGDAVAIKRHPEFRLFAAMNPATDAGKKDLPASIRSRFTEIYVEELCDPIELRTVATSYLSGVLSCTSGPIEQSETIANVVDVYLRSRELADKTLVDASGQRPRYTLRTMCRALAAARNLIVQQKLTLDRGILEGFELAFEGQLGTDSLKKTQALFKPLLTEKCGENLNKPGRRPGGRMSESKYVSIKPFWIERGPLELEDWSVGGKAGRAKFILTKSMALNLRRLSRAVAAGPWPVLLEGPTSAGKTTLVEYLAARCGHKVVRINNHEHTDVQEYTGSYSSDENGSLSFCDGILVKALRHGHWVILDELNLAPSEVLEALNRLLDDNRELYLAEINETVKPHPNFHLFATQNPSGVYGGRKPLSRAFRNRFVEIHMGDIPSDELVTILEKRSGCPPSHAKVLVKIMTSLRQRRSKSGVFLGKDGLITPRDLLRWAERRAGSKTELGEEGFMLLGERLRGFSERELVRTEIEKELKVSINCHDLYFGKDSLARKTFRDAVGNTSADPSLKLVAQTTTLLRLLTLVLRCIKQKEPVLLVGDTGCGKTTIVQLLSAMMQRNLRIVNCHATTETSDLIGSLRPVRGREKLISEIISKFRNLIEYFPDETILKNARVPEALASINGEDAVENSVASCNPSRIVASTQLLLQFYEESKKCEDLEEKASIKRRKLENGCAELAKGNTSTCCSIEVIVEDIKKLNQSYSSLFQWVDGSLVEAMRKGDLFLLDEMSLAEDAVLERLNSVLENSRTIVLAEKGDDGRGDESHIVKANENFLIFATMNPGGDFGKRELSPALRSRFTEIWVPSSFHLDDIDLVLTSNLTDSPCHVNCDEIKRVILAYVHWFNTNVCNDSSGPYAGLSLSLRDVITWARFVLRVCGEMATEIDQWEALCHGAALMHLDGLGLGTGLSKDDAESAKKRSISYMIDLIPIHQQERCHASFKGNEIDTILTRDRFGIRPFLIPFGPNSKSTDSFNFQAPTSCLNLMRVLRAMQLSKPILLEGSPGVGKTSLISALAKAAGYNLVRINLSEQTDIADLMGSDLPFPDDNDDLESASSSSFKWCDGVLLRAIKRGDWVLLDELNLASQSVLEGLNSCLDHRASVFIPELGKTFECPDSFRIFAAQNPLGQGGGRKGLPKSFLNRFTKVYIESLNDNDLTAILQSSYPDIPSRIRSAMISFNNDVHWSVSIKKEFGDCGHPWEFNLRDVFRWCELAKTSHIQNPQIFSSCARDLYLQRFRTVEDRVKVAAHFNKYFDYKIDIAEPEEFFLSEDVVTIGSTTINRCRGIHNVQSQGMGELPIIRDLLLPMEAAGRCVLMNWPCLLVGASGSGKTSTIRTLANLVNAKLVNICLAPSTDVNELVGSFEQIDINNNKKLLLEKLFEILDSCFDGTHARCEHISIRAKLFRHREILEEALSLHSTGAPHSQILQIASDIISLIKPIRPDNEIRQLEDLTAKLCNKNANGEGRFHWVDGILVEAMTKGLWLHLENVNLCSSSVLDRLNPLMEPGGELLLTESGTQEGGASFRSIKPHSNFRLFLSMNPDRGEISRAMRNRCVEIALLRSSKDTMFDNCSMLCTTSQVMDQVDILSRYGVRSTQEASSILLVHEKAVATQIQNVGHDFHTECPRWVASRMKGLRERGIGFDYSKSFSILLTYGRSIKIDISNHNISMEAPDILPMVPSIQTGWLTNTANSSFFFKARLMYLLFFNLPDWLQRFTPLQENEDDLNCIFSSLPEGKDGMERIKMHAFAFFLLVPWCRTTNFTKMASLLDHYSKKNSQTLKSILDIVPKIGEDRLSFMLDRIAYLAMEQEAGYKMMNTSEVLTNEGSLSLFDVSFWLSVGKIERSLVSCSITPAFYPLFQALENFSNDLLHLRNCETECDTLDKPGKKALRIFFRMRDHLWIYLKETEYQFIQTSPFLCFDETGFIVQWIWFKKALDILSKEFHADRDIIHSEARQRVDALIYNIDRALLGGDGFLEISGDIVWKRSGHPLVPSKPHLFETIKKIQMTCAECSILSKHQFNSLVPSGFSTLTIETLIEEKHPLLFLNHVHKQELLESLSMAYWSSTAEMREQVSEKSSIGDHLSLVICSRVEEAKTKFETEWKKTQIDSKISTVENLMDVEVLKRLQSEVNRVQSKMDTDLLQDIMKRFSLLQIAPLVEYWLIHEEWKIINRLMYIFWTSLHSAESRHSLASSAKNFVTVALTSPGWHVGDLRPFQTLIWAFESVASIDSFRHLLKCLIPTILHNALNHLWQNTFNGLGHVSTMLEIPHQWSNTKGTKQEPASSLQASVGPTRIFEYVRTDTVLKLVGAEFAASIFGTHHARYLTIENHLAREYQAKEAIFQLSAFNVFESESNYPVEVVYLFLNTIEAIQNYFPESPVALAKELLLDAREVPKEKAFELHELLERCSYSRFRDCLERLVYPLVDSLMAARNLKEQANISLSWIYIGLLRSHLLAPQTPIDPGQKPLAKVKQLNRRLSCLQGTVAAYRLHSGIRSGNFSPTDTTIDMWTSEAKLLLEKKSNQEKKVVLRGETCASFFDLFREVRGFWQTVATPSVVLGIVSALSNFSTHQSDDVHAALKREDSWQLTTSSFCQRLKDHYTCYDDVITPFIMAVQCIQRGLRELKDLTVSKPSSFSSLLVDMLRFPFEVNSDHKKSHREALLALSNVKNNDTENMKQCKFTLALSLLSRIGIQRRVNRSLDPASVRYCRSVLGEILKSWVAHIEGDVQNYTDDEKQEQLYREQFPDHNKEFATFIESQEDDTSNDDSDKDDDELIDSSSKISSMALSDYHISIIYDLYVEAFTGISTFDMDLARMRDFKLVYIAAYMLRSNLSVSGQMFQNPFLEKMGSNCLAMSLASKGTTRIQTSLTSSRLSSFHHDPNPREVKKASSCLRNLESRISQLLTAFPGNEILLALGSVVEFVRKLELTSTSVGKAMTGLEVVLRKAQEWEQHASEKVMFGSCLAEVGQLVAVWRKLELKSWESLLVAREERYHMRARRHWLRLCGILNDVSGDVNNTTANEKQSKKPNSSPTWLWKENMKQRSTRTSLGTEELKDLEQVTTVVDTFVLTSCIGEFKGRISIVDTLAHYFLDSNTSREQNVFRLLRSVASYYSQFIPYISSRQACLREPLEKKLRDEVKISKWDEQSYYALVDSTEKNHRKLMKVLREYDDILDMPISALLEQHYSYGIRSSGDIDSEMSIKVPSNRELFPLLDNNQASEVINSQNGFNKPQGGIPSFNGSIDVSSYEFVRRLPHYYRRLTSIVETEIVKSTSWGHISASNSSALSAQIFERIESLRKDNTTKQMKQRALTDLLKTLKKNGFKTTKWSVPSQLRQIVHLFQLPVPACVKFLSMPKLQSSLDSANTYFQRTVTEVRRLQAEISIFGSKHMTKRETEMMQGLSEHGLLLLSQERSIIAEAIRDISDLKIRIDVLSSLSSGIPRGQDRLLGLFQKFSHALQASNESIKQLKLFISTMLEMSKTDEVTTSKRDAISVLDQCINLMQDDLLRTNIEIITSDERDKVIQMRNNMKHVQKYLQSLQNTCCHDDTCLPCDVFDTCASMVRKTIDISDEFARDMVKRDKEITTNSDFSVFLQSTSMTLKSVIFAVQKLHKSSVFSSSMSEASLSELSIWDSHMNFCRELKDLDIGDIASCLKDTTDNLVLIHSSKLVSTEEERSLSLSVTMATQLMVKQVYSLCISRLEDAISSFRNTAKLQYILSRVFRVLVSKGYCADKSEEGSEGDNLDDLSGMKFEDDVEGTGMGEGDGKEDVTDQLESEEQIQGLKDEDQKENRENDSSKQLEEEEAKQGMEMTEDFEGEMFDVPDETKDENEENGEEEEEELDRQMGMDANDNEEVVDEKMWGDSDDEQDIDKEEEKFERDSNVKGQAMEDEMRTKDDGEDNGCPEADDTNNQAQEREEQPRNDENDSVVNEDKEDDYEDKHNGVDVREEEDGRDGGGEIDDNDDEQDMDIDDINISDDNDSGNESDNGIEDQSNIENEFDSEIDGDNENPGEKDDSEEDDDAMDATAISDGNTGEPNEEQNDEEQNDEEQRVNQSAMEKSEREAFGLRSKGGADNVKDKTEEEDDDDDAVGGPDDAGGVGNDSQQDPSSGTNGDGMGEGDEQEKGLESIDSIADNSAAPNPFKNPGDATKFWHRRLQMVERRDIPQEESDMDEDKIPPSEGGDREDKDIAVGEFEYANKNEDSSTQVMGETADETKKETDLEEGKNKEQEECLSSDEIENKLNNKAETSEKEKKSFKSKTKPVDSSKTLEEKSANDEEENGDEDEVDMVDSCDLSNRSQSDSDDMSMDENDAKEGGNKIISDLKQLTCEDENNEDNVSYQKVLGEDEITGISSQEMEDARVRWNKILGETSSLSRRLCEQLRLVMEPLLATKLKGDYRTGKRINMKKVIGYIASGYRKDKIWLRRTKPAKRNYRILLAVDNSESMKSSGAGDMALAAMATLATGMSQLEVGELGIASFGNEMRLLHPFHLPFTSESGSSVLHNFPFDEKRTRTALCVESALAALDMAGCDRASLQLVFLISDGRIERDSRSNLRRLMREMVERNILLVMIVVEGRMQSVQDGESTKKKYKKKDSIVNMKEVTFENGKPRVKQFIEDYPFPYYIILDDMLSLPEVLGNALRQWFEMISQLQQNP